MNTPNDPPPNEPVATVGKPFLIGKSIGVPINLKAGPDGAPPVLTREMLEEIRKSALEGLGPDPSPSAREQLLEAFEQITSGIADKPVHVVAATTLAELLRANERQLVSASSAAMSLGKLLSQTEVGQAVFEAGIAYGHILDARALLEMAADRALHAAGLCDCHEAPTSPAAAPAPETTPADG